MFKIPLLTITLFLVSFANSDSVNTIRDFASDACLPEVHFIYDNTTQSFCLNNLVLDDSSCINFGITLKKTYNVTAHFTKQIDKKWQFDSVSRQDENPQSENIRVNLATDESGLYQKLFIFAGKFSDSNSVNLMLKKQYDMPENKNDTAPSISDFLISKTTFPCNKHPRKDTVYYDYNMEYSTGYVRGEKELNYPELKMFHYGAGVKMPSYNQVWEWGMQLAGYHQLHRSDRKSDFYVLCTGPERYVPPKKDKKERKRFFTIKPLK